MFDIRSAPTFEGFEDVAQIEQWMDENPAPFSTTFELLNWAAQHYSDHTALRFLRTGTLEEEGDAYSYRDFQTKVIQTANSFYAKGGATPTVGLMLPNLPETLFSILGAQAVGIVEPLNPFLEGEHLVALLNNAKADVFVTLGPNVGGEIWTKALEVVPQISSLKALYVIDSATDFADLSAKLGIPVYNFTAEIASQSGEALATDHNREGAALASYFHTGGTTGAPKLAQHTHQNEVENALSLALAYPGKPGDVCFVGLPLFHVNAVIGTGIASLLKGHTILLGTAGGYRTPEVIANFWGLIEKHQVTLFSCVPTVLNMLLDSGGSVEKADSLETVICGAAPLTKALAERFTAATGAHLAQGYGLTEGTCVSTITPMDAENVVGPVGVGLPGQRVRVVQLTDDFDIKKDCAVEEIGAVLIRGKNVFKGYLEAERNKGVLLADGWLNTGDLGKLDAEGRVWLTGRQKDLIIRGGHNIDPAVIEEALMRHPDVSNVAAVGQPDAYAGEVPCAFVVLKSGADISEDDLIAFAAQEVAERAARPQHIDILDEMPVTRIGKIFKPDLRLMAAQRVLREELRKSDPKGQVHLDEDNIFTIEADLNSAVVEEMMANYSVEWRFA